MQDIKFIKVIISVVITMALFQHTSIYDSANCLRVKSHLPITVPAQLVRGRVFFELIYHFAESSRGAKIIN